MATRKTNERCEQWLRVFLHENGKTMTQVVRNVGRLNGFTKGQISQAKKNLQLQTLNNYDKETGIATEWYWKLKD